MESSLAATDDLVLLEAASTVAPVHREDTIGEEPHGVLVEDVAGASRYCVASTRLACPRKQAGRERTAVLAEPPATFIVHGIGAQERIRGGLALEADASQSVGLRAAMAVEPPTACTFVEALAQRLRPVDARRLWDWIPLVPARVLTTRASTAWLTAASSSSVTQVCTDAESD